MKRYLVSAALTAAGISMVATRPVSLWAQAQSQLQFGSLTLSAGASPSAAKIGDLDGDGLNDIAVVNLTGNLQLFFNNGAGSFQRVSLNGLWPSSAQTRGVDIGDLNGDGRNDLGVAFSTQGGAVSVLLNQGNRTFAAPVNYGVCDASNGVAIADLDRDGDNDLADIGQCSKAGILVNNGHGGFAFNGTYGGGNSSSSIVLADFNSDGVKDVAYLNSTANGTVTVLFNNGNGSFGAPTFLYAGDLPSDIAAGDFDGDGTTDLAIANAYFSQIILLFNDRTGGFTTGYSELSGPDTPTSIVSADFDGDGRLDAAVTSWGTNRLSVFLSDGNYGLANGPTFYLGQGQSPVDIVAGDLNGDGKPDLISVNQGGGSITLLLSGVVVAPPPPPAPITLTASTRTTKDARLVDLAWSGAASSSVDIYRNGSRLTTVANTGRYTNQFGSRQHGVFRYKVCVASGAHCSAEVAISF